MKKQTLIFAGLFIGGMIVGCAINRHRTKKAAEKMSSAVGGRAYASSAPDSDITNRGTDCGSYDRLNCGTGSASHCNWSLNKGCVDAGK